MSVLGAASAKPAGVLDAASSQDARRAAMLAKLTPKKMGDRKMPAIILLEANKGIKTVAALALPLEEGVSKKGTPIHKTPGLPIPDGPVTVVSFDHQSEGSLSGYYGDTQPAINKVDFVPIRQMMGFNAGKPKTANDVVDGLRFLLESWQNDKRAMLIMDRWDEFTENIVKLVCYAKAGLPADAGLVDRGVWGPRRPLIYEVIDLMLGAVKEDGVIWLTGSADKDEGAKMVTVVNGKTIIDRVPTKWAARVEMHANARITGVVGEGPKGETVRYLTSVYSRYGPIPEGVRVPINGRNAGAFQDAATLIQVEDKDEAPNVLNKK